MSPTATEKEGGEREKTVLWRRRRLAGRAQVEATWTERETEADKNQSHRDTKRHTGTMDAPLFASPGGGAKKAPVFASPGGGAKTAAGRQGLVQRLQNSRSYISVDDAQLAKASKVVPLLSSGDRIEVSSPSLRSADDRQEVCVCARACRTFASPTHYRIQH